MSNSSPPDITVSQQGTTFPQHAAKGSWVCGLLIVGVIALGHRSGAQLIVALAAFILMVIGFLLGLIALFSIPRHGTKGILGPALIGLTINGLFLFIFVTNFMAGRAKALEAGKQAALPSIVYPASGKAVL